MDEESGRTENRLNVLTLIGLDKHFSNNLVPQYNRSPWQFSGIPLSRSYYELLCSFHFPPQFLRRGAEWFTLTPLLKGNYVAILFLLMRHTDISSLYFSHNLTSRILR